MSNDTTTRRRRLTVAAIVLGVLAGVLIWNVTKADAATCVTGTITWHDPTPQWTPTFETADLNVQIEGHFLWVQAEANRELGEASNFEDGVVSVELFGTETGATVCPDGSVTLESRSIAIGQPVVVVEVWVDLSLRLMRGIW